MKTWRERFAERTPFRNRDFERWSNTNTCPAAEVARRYGVTWSGPYSGHRPRDVGPWHALWDIGDTLNGPMERNDYAACEAILDQIEDKALEIKRTLRNWTLRN